MFGHFPELVIILIVGLIIFGPEKLPEMAANAGKMMRDFRTMVDDTMHPHDTEVPDDFATYYHESLARNGEEPPPDADPEFMSEMEGSELHPREEEPLGPSGREI
jgi:TatA/E family protein of Tat protein translocase